MKTDVFITGTSVFNWYIYIVLTADLLLPHFQQKCTKTGQNGKSWDKMQQSVGLDFF